jgi:GntP family gluconate:H+ symporter
MVAPVVAILLLSLRPLCNIIIDPLIALPAGGLVGIIATRKWSMLKESMAYGLEKMSFVAILVIGTGAIAGISGIWGAAMINSGATVLDHLPHGSFYHATGGSVNLSFNERLKLVPYETAIGLILTIGSVATYLFVR